MQLPEAAYQYKFKVDGTWRTSPCDPLIATEGIYNNLRVVHGAYTLTWPQPAGSAQQEVMVVGDWSGWADAIPLVAPHDGGPLEAAVALPSGDYHYRYLVDGRYRLKSWEELGEVDGRQVHKLHVHETPSFKIFYATGWARCDVRYRFRQGSYTTAWEQRSMHDAPSRASPCGGRWKTLTVPVPEPQQLASPCDAAASSSSSSDGAASGSGGHSDAGSAPSHVQLEFVVVGPPSGTTDSWGSKDEDVDRGPTNAHYTLTRPGGWKLLKGSVWPFERATQPPIMLCSDIDGTMIGEGARADERTREFTDYWENSASLAGCVLVYNTGRSLGQFSHLWVQKDGTLALPDVLITAVGTKIWHLSDVHRGMSGTVSDFQWHEDEAWAARLADGWDLGRVRKVAMRLIDKQGDGKLHWLDRGDEHPHRIALSAHVALVPRVVEGMQSGLAEVGVKARIITSGQGDYRYVDVVAHLAGKLEALEYVRALYNIPRARCVAAGDSGNDILMLQGAHPAIIVGNAQRELVDWYSLQPEPPEQIVKTDAPLASGIMEGLARFGLL